MRSSGSPQVIICRPQAQDICVAAVRKRSACRWVYFGRDWERYRRIKQAIPGEFEAINAGELINRMGSRIRAEFIEFDRYLQADASDLFWQTTDLLEKNPYSSDLFFHCCAYFAFNQILKDLRSDLVVFVEDSFIVLEFARLARGLGFHVECIGGNLLANLCPERLIRAFGRVERAARALLCRARLIADFLSWKHAIGRHARNNGPENSNAFGQVEALLVIWADGKTFTPKRPKRTDTYLGDLPALLLEGGKKVGYLAHPISWVATQDEILEDIQASPDPILFLHECLRLPQMLRIALETLFRSWKVGSGFVINGVDLTRLVQEHAARERAKSRQSLAFLYYYVGRFLFQKGIRPSLVLFPYENQPWEKALRLGIKKYLPDTKIMAYQHAPFPKFQLGPFASYKDLKPGSIPHFLVVLGPRWKEVFVEHGWPEESVIEGPAFRFQHLLDSRSADGVVDTSRGDRKPVILLAASISYSDSFELTAKTIEAFREESDVDVLLKFHPRMSSGSDALVRAVTDCLGLNGLPAHFSVTDRPIPELLLQVDVVLHNGTAVGLEAHVAGVPELLVQSDLWFNMNNLDLFEESAVSSGTPEQLRRSVSHLLDHEAQAAERDGRIASFPVEEFFSPVTEETIRCFLELSSFSGEYRLH